VSWRSRHGQTGETKVTASEFVPDAFVAKAVIVALLTALIVVPLAIPVP